MTTFTTYTPWLFLVLRVSYGVPDMSSKVVPGPLLNIKMVFLGIGSSIMRPSYLYNGNRYTGKTTSLYWDADSIVNNFIDFINKVNLWLFVYGMGAKIFIGSSIMRPSYLYNGNRYTGKTTSLYWDADSSFNNFIDFINKVNLWLFVYGMGAKIFMAHLYQSLTHLPWTKWPLFHRRYFQLHFREWKVLHFD